MWLQVSEIEVLPQCGGKGTQQFLANFGPFCPNKANFGPFCQKSLDFTLNLIFCFLYQSVIMSTNLLENWRRYSYNYFTKTRYWLVKSFIYLNVSNLPSLRKTFIYLSQIPPKISWSKVAYFSIFPFSIPYTRLYNPLLIWNHSWLKPQWKMK